MATDFGFKPYEGNEPYAFLSYRSIDVEKVAPIARALNDAGTRVWYDFGITLGRNWQEQIIEKIETASIIFLFITKHSFESSHIGSEFHAATSFNKVTIPIFLENISSKDVPSKSLRFYLEIQRIQCINAVKKSPSECANILLRQFPELKRSENNDEKRVYFDEDIDDGKESEQRLHYLQEHEHEDEQTHQKKINRLQTQLRRLEKLQNKPSLLTKITDSLPLTLVSAAAGLYLLYIGLYFIYTDSIGSIINIGNSLQLDKSILVAVIALLFVILISVNIKKILINQKPIEIDASEIEQLQITIANLRNSNRLPRLFIPITLLNVIMYIITFAFQKENLILLACLNVGISLACIHYSLQIKTYLVKLSSENKKITKTKVICMFSLVLSAVIIFAVLTYLMYLGNPNSYTEINYTSWYHAAFVFFYHSFSMCIRNESDIAIPLSALSQSINMLQMCICYFIILYEVSDIFDIGHKKN